MRYLISLEGKLYKIIEGKEEMQQYLKDYANLLKQEKCKNVDQWLQEMLENGFSNIYTYFPDFVIPFNEWQIEK